jgi:rRNA-processing protein FCF1
MLDSNVADLLIGDPVLRARVQSLEARAIIRLVKTHVQDDEHANTPDAARRQCLFDAFEGAEKRNPHVFALDQANLDNARFAGPKEGALYDAVYAKNPRHTRDGIIAATAVAECDVLVTNDGRMAKKAQKAGIKVWSPQDFKAFVERATRS